MKADRVTADNERKVLELFIQTCRALRDPRNRRSRVELVGPASQWEMRFNERLVELDRELQSEPQPQEKAA